MTRTEFWEMDAEEAFWLIAAKTPPKRYGKLTEAEAEELYQENLAEIEGQANGVRDDGQTYGLG